MLVVIAYFFGAQKIGSNIKIDLPTSTEEPTATEIQKPGTVKPTLDPTAGWKIYTSDEYGFSFKYPATRVSGVDVQGSTLVDLEMDNKRFFSTFNQSYSIQEWLEDAQSGKIIGKKQIGDFTYTVVQGGLTLESLEYILDVRGNGIVRFVIEPNTNTAESEMILDQILSTFKFTN